MDRRATSREEIKRLIDVLPDQELHAVRRYLQFLRFMNDPPFIPADHFLMNDPVARNLASAPADDEPLTKDDLEAIAESDDDFAAGRIVALEDLKRNLET